MLSRRYIYISLINAIRRKQQYSPFIQAIPGTRFTVFYSISIHTLILRAFIICKQEETLLFLEFKVYSLIYYNLLLKVTDFIIGGFLNSTKKNYLTGVRSSIINHQSSIINHQSSIL